MSKKIDIKNLRPSTKYRILCILKAYEDVMTNLGEYKDLVPKSFIYEQVKEKTGSCVRTIQDAINHYASLSAELAR